MATDKRKVTVNDQQKKPGKTGTWKPRQGQEVIRRDTSGVPIRRFGKGNNFHRFLQAGAVRSIPKGIWEPWQAHPERNIF